MASKLPMSTAERVAKRRAALRAQGLRPRTFWLPDTSTAEFSARMRRDLERLWELEGPDAEAMAWVQAMTDDLLRDHPY